MMSYQGMTEFMDILYRADPNVLPSRSNVFLAFRSVPEPSDCKVIIVGQDPYADEKLATGLAFSVPENCKIPPSLKNIFKEMVSDLNVPMPTSGDLLPWANQGVLLLNTALTVRAGESGSHLKMGWSKFILEQIGIALEDRHPMVIIAFGKEAKTLVKQIPTHSNLLILEGSHPSPLSAHTGFFGNKYFSKANEFLASKGAGIINWELK